MALTLNDLQIESLIWKQLQLFPTGFIGENASVFLNILLSLCKDRLDGDTYALAIPNLKALTTGGSYRGAQTRAITVEDTGDEAKWSKSELDATVTVSERDLENTNTNHSIISIAKVKAVQLKDRVNTLVSNQIFGTKSGENVEGFGDMLSLSSTYGQLVVATWANWIAGVVNTTTTTISNANTIFKVLLSPLTDGEDSPDLIVARQSAHAKLMGTVSALTDFISVQDFGAKGGVLIGTSKIARYYGRPVIIDQHVSGSDGGTQDNNILALNTKYLKIAVAPTRDFRIDRHEPLPTSHSVTYQANLAWAFGCNNRLRQGGCFNIDTDL